MLDSGVVEAPAAARHAALEDSRGRHAVLRRPVAGRAGIDVGVQIEVAARLLQRVGVVVVVKVSSGPDRLPVVLGAGTFLIVPHSRHVYIILWPCELLAMGFISWKFEVCRKTTKKTYVGHGHGRIRLERGRSNTLGTTFA